MRDISEALIADYSRENLFEMANIRGKYLTVEDIDFSFYYSSKDNVNSQHGIHVKICWNREKIGLDLLDGYLELHGDYKYISGSHPNIIPDSVDLATARYFFKRYKVLFAAVWENKLDENNLSDFLRGKSSFKELLSTFEELDTGRYNLINNCNTVKELEKVVREYNIFNLND